MTTKLQTAVGIGAAVLGVAAAYNLGKAHGAKDDSKCTRPNKPRAGDLKEFSVVYTDRATNLMSSKFQTVMREIGSTLKEVYNTDALALIPGSGSYAMEAAARQFGRGKKCLILRNGYFSFRWSDINDQCGLFSEEVVVKARAVTEGPNPMFAPAPIEEVVAAILKEKPSCVFAPHVETATGIILPDAYVKAVADAVHQVGGLFVLDSIASGTIWVDMKALGIDALITAPQKGWSGPACVGIVMMNNKAKEVAKAAEVPACGSFTCNLKKWTEVMDKYEAGAFMYYTTLPTDSLMSFRNAIMETKAHGLEKAKSDLFELGSKVRRVLEKNGFASVAAKGFQSPGVVVSYAKDATMVGKFKGEGLQIAGGVPFKIGEPEGMFTFRLGLFGLDKIGDIDGTVAIFEKALLGVKSA